MITVHEVAVDGGKTIHLRKVIELKVFERPIRKIAIAGRAYKGGGMAERSIAARYECAITKVHKETADATKARLVPEAWACEVEALSGSRRTDLIEQQIVPAGPIEAIKILMSTLGPATAAMFQAIKKNSVSEVDVINGGVFTEGRKVGIPTPLNDAVLASIHWYEESQKQPYPDPLLSLTSSTQAELLVKGVQRIFPSVKSL